MRHEDIKGGLSWGHAGLMLEWTDALLSPWSTWRDCPVTPGRIPSLFCPPRDYRSPWGLFPRQKSPEVDSVAAFAQKTLLSPPPEVKS